MSAMGLMQTTRRHTRTAALSAQPTIDQQKCCASGSRSALVQLHSGVFPVGQGWLRTVRVTLQRSQSAHNCRWNFVVAWLAFTEVGICAWRSAPCPSTTFVPGVAWHGIWGTKGGMRAFAANANTHNSLIKKSRRTESIVLYCQTL